MANKKLSPAQERVMALMSRRWPAEQSGSMAVHINGKRVCNTDTMTVLEQQGLVTKDSRWTWKATEAGLQWAEPVTNGTVGATTNNRKGQGNGY